MTIGSVDGAQDLWRSGGWYRAVRIPAIVALDARRLVAMAVGRYRVSDYGPSDLLIRRSDDSGSSWTRSRVLVRGRLRTVDNPTLLVDPATEALHLFYQVGYRRLLQRISRDGGWSFGPEIDRTGVTAGMQAGKAPMVRFAPGPGAGAALPSGRLIIPVWATGPRRKPSVTLTVYSDDHGETWHRGDVIAGPRGAYPNPSEATIAPTASGAIVGVRQSSSRHRIFAWSADGAHDWSAARPAEELFEPVGHAALGSVSGADGVRRLAFVNPDSRDSRTPALADGKLPRENLTLRWSDDDGRSWGPPTVIDAGASGYAAMSADATGTLHLLWEHGRLRGTALWPRAIRYGAVRPGRVP